MFTARLLATIFLPLTLFSMEQERNVTLKINNGETFVLPYNKINQFKKLRKGGTIFREDRSNLPEQSIDISNMDFAFANNIKALINIMPDYGYSNEERPLSKDFKQNLKLAILSKGLVSNEKLALNTEWYRELNNAFSHSTIEASNYETIRKWIGKYNRSSNIKERLLSKIKMPCIRTLEGHADTVRALIFIPQNKLLASGSDDTNIKIWNPNQQYKCMQTLEGHEGAVCSLVYLDKNHHLASGSADTTIRIWDLEQGTCIRTLTEHTDSAIALAVDPKSGNLCSGSHDRTIREWIPERLYSLTNTIENTYAKGDEKKCFCGGAHTLVFDPKSNHLISAAMAYDRQGIKVWNRSNMFFKQVKTLPLKDDYGINDLIITPNGKHLISASNSGNIEVWDLENACSHYKTLEGHTRRGIDILRFTPDGKYLISVSGESEIKIWDPKKDYECVNTLEGHYHKYGTACLTFNPENDDLISGSYDKTIKIWKISPEEIKLEQLNSQQLFTLNAFIQNKAFVSEEHKNDFNELPKALQEYFMGIVNWNE